MRAAHLGLLLVVAACGPDPEGRIRELAPQIAALHEEAAANRSFLDASRNNPDTTVAFSADDLARAADDVLPLRLDAASFHKQLQGTIVVEKLAIQRFSAGNRLDGVVTLRGESIRFTGQVPAMFKADVARFIAGVQSGVNVSLRMSAVFAAPKLEVHVTALDATMAKNGGNESMLIDEMNKRALREPFLFDLSADPRLKPIGALVTAQHLVLQYNGTGSAAPAPAPAPRPAPATTPTTPANPAPAPTGGPRRPTRPGG